MNEQKPNGRYDSTRQAWENIWTEASVEVELQSVHYPRAVRTVEAFLPYLNKEGVILEAGSGLSAQVISLRERGYNVIGCDYAVNALLKSHEVAPDLPLYAADIHDLPHAADSIDAILSFGVLEHFEHGMQPALVESFRVLRSGGVLVLTIPYPNVIWKLAQWKRERAGQQLIDDDFYESTYTADQLRAEVMQADFKVEEVRPTSHNFTFWGAHRVFQAPGYYRTSRLANWLGAITERVTPWAFNYMTLVVARKP